MKALWGLRILSTFLIVIGCNEAFPVESRNLDKFDQSGIVHATPNELSRKEDSLLLSSEIIKDTLNAQPKEDESTVYIVDDVPNVEFKIVKEQNTENYEKIHHPLDDKNNPAYVQDVYHISKSPNKLLYRSRRFIPESQVHTHSSRQTSSGGNQGPGSQNGDGQGQGNMGGNMNGNMWLGGGMGGMGGMGMPMGGMGGMGMGGLGMGGLGMGGLGMGGLGMGGLNLGGMGGMGMGGISGMGMSGMGMGGMGMGGMGGMGMGGIGMPMGGMGGMGGMGMGGMGLGGMGMGGMGMGGMGMPMGGMGGMGMGGMGMPMGGMGMGGMGGPMGGGIPPMAGMPPAAYIPAPGGGIIPAIPPSTFIPPPPMPFPGAWGPHGFPGHAVGFPILTPSFSGGPLVGG